MWLNNNYGYSFVVLRFVATLLAVNILPKTYPLNYTLTLFLCCLAYLHIPTRMTTLLRSEEHKNQLWTLTNEHSKENEKDKIRKSRNILALPT